MKKILWTVVWLLPVVSISRSALVLLNRELPSQPVVAPSKFPDIVSSSPTGTTRPHHSPAESSPTRAAKIAEKTEALLDYFASHPDQAIPEIELLTDDQWIKAAANADTSAPNIKKAAAELRMAAKREFIGRLASAYQRYLQTNDGKRPATLEEINAYFVRPVPLSLYQRYEFSSENGLPAPTSEKLPIIWEKSAIDRELDSRGGVSGEGRQWYGRNGIRGWIPYPDGYDAMMKNVRASYSADHHGAAPENLEVLRSYFETLMPKEMADALIKTEQRK
ncbi:hypothetical protein [Oleiharenicola lentus]|uniref:hypothetical protein n=1 Tax=Oleiharenicola lentus TaxID=2508720 RepID=UPI003F668B0F